MRQDSSSGGKAKPARFCAAFRKSLHLTALSSILLVAKPVLSPLLVIPVRRTNNFGAKKGTIVTTHHHARTGAVSSASGMLRPQLGPAAAGKYQRPISRADARRLTVGDILAAYTEARQAKIAGRKEFLARMRFLNEFFGTEPVANINGDRCRVYVEHRSRERNRVERERIAKLNAAAMETRRALLPAWRDKDFTSGPRRDLEDLRSAINFWAKEYGLDPKPSVTLPDKPAARERWLTREEAAGLLRAALRLRRKHGQYAHLCRFIIVGLYTGCRHRSILQLNWDGEAAEAWPDLGRGVFYCKDQHAKKSKKWRPPTRLPSRLIAHMRRWKRIDCDCGPVVHDSLGEPTKRIEKAFRTCRVEAGLGDDVTPNVLRYTRAMWPVLCDVDMWRIASKAMRSGEIA
ncbi:MULTISPECIES: hypothetical protein [unclassified Mesorhizobium]|uniref:hypothetical protein n=1 Tax=unclassified Mesorhizobium TaxID=325217 RepID=UPI00333CACCA